MPEEVKTLIESKTDIDKAKRLTSPKRWSGMRKAVLAKITLLDNSIVDVYVDRKDLGRDLLDRICESLDILEKDYFGLAYDSNKSETQVWIDPDKQLGKFMKNEPWKLYFRIKFYPSDPASLQEDLTRYQLCLQIRNDLLTGRLPCSFITYSLLGSYMVQSELGNYDPTEMGPDYLKDFKFAPNQTSALEEKVMELHKTHTGQTPAEAELNYLENAKKLSMYGFDMHSAKDSEGVDIQINVCSSGILIYREKLRINRFAWPKILKICFRRHNFKIKIRPGEYEQYETTVSFKLADRYAAKKLWKVCVEQHRFFRSSTPAPLPKSTILPRFGSQFRYSGRTLYECRRNVIDRDAPQFQRMLSGSHINIKTKNDDQISKRHTLSNPPEYTSDYDIVKSDKKKIKRTEIKTED